jgi:hypothetical protein
MRLVAFRYVLIERLRALALHGTQLATALVDTLRIKLLKVAARDHAQYSAYSFVLGLQLAQCRYL